MIKASYHGTVYGYASKKCKCVSCKIAYRLYRRKYRAEGRDKWYNKSCPRKVKAK